MLDSNHHKIYQVNVECSGNQKFASGWKSLDGYFNESKRLSICLLINAKNTQKYTLHAIVKFAGDMTPDEHQEVWKKFTRNMRQKGIIAFWVREPTLENQVHYHLIVVAPQAIETAKDAIEKACPRSHIDRLKLHFGAIEHQVGFCHHISKAKVEGYINEKYTSDKWQMKRLLFAKDIKLEKHGSIGKFWLLPKATIWKGVIEREKGIKLHEDQVYEDAKRLYQLVSVSVPSLKYVVRNLAYFAWKDTK